MRIVGAGERIRVGKGTAAGLPKDFTWRGRRHEARAVEVCRDWGGRGQGARKRILRLRTATGMRCLLSLDPRDGSWRIEQVLPATGG
jgi:hypothetical protein